MHANAYINSIKHPNCLLQTHLRNTRICRFSSCLQRANFFPGQLAQVCCLCAFVSCHAHTKQSIHANTYINRVKHPNCLSQTHLPNMRICRLTATSNIATEFPLASWRRFVACVRLFHVTLTKNKKCMLIHI